MANTVNETDAKYISKLAMDGTTYTIKDEWARAEIEEVKSAAAGGVVFRGVSTTAIKDNDAVKDLTVGSETYAADSQATGDLFIYNNGSKNLEFVVVNGKYSEFGSTGELGSLAFADKANGSVVVPLASAITLDSYTPQVGNGTLAVKAVTADVATSATAATIATSATAATLGTTTAAATITRGEAQATVDDETADATISTQSTTVTAAGPTVTLDYTKGTFTALKDISYDSTTATLSISSATSDEFTKVPSVKSVGDISVKYDKTTGVSYTKTTTVRYNETTAVSYVKATGVTYEKTSAVTYEKASGTFLSSATLDGELKVTAAAPTATITNPTITVTVDPIART